MRVEVFFVGPGKCGTSWIHEYLRLHPDAAVPSIKEPNYWLAPDPARLGSYHGLWADSPSGRFCEVSNTYCFDPEVAHRLWQYNPQARIVLTVRNPVERLASRYLFMRRNGVTTRSLAETLQERPELVAQCRYHEVAQPWLDVFPRNQVSLLVLEELKADPNSYAAKLCEAVGIPFRDPASVPAEARLGAARPRSVLAARGVKEAALIARRLGLYGLLERVKRSSVTRLLYAPVDYSTSDVVAGALQPSEVEALLEQWRSLVQLLDPAALPYAAAPFPLPPHSPTFSHGTEPSAGP